MKFTRNVKAISKLLLILLLLLATIVGAILSYLWVIGYVINLGISVPEKTTVSIANVTFDNQNTSYFFATLLNPSYSPTEANITEIMVSTGEDIYNITEVHPLLPYRLSKGEEETFKCVWDWANYTGETLRIIAFVAGGSGPTLEAETPRVDLQIELSFDSAISVTHFNVTVQNSLLSVTHVNITGITVTGEDQIVREWIGENGTEVDPDLPYPLNISSSETFVCPWNWTNYQNTSVTVAVQTLQGYMNNTTIVTPLPVTLEITNVDFNPASTIYFAITVRNNEFSPTLNITRITVTGEGQIVREWTMENGTEIDPDLPYPLDTNSSETFICPWNWTDYRGKIVTITVYTLQDFMAQYTQVTPAPIILEIINPIFNPLEANSFNVTVKNSEFSVIVANVTEITVTVDGVSGDITDVVPPLQGGIPLSPGANQTFTCSWNWTGYSGKNVTIFVKTQEGYSANSSPVLLKALTITDVLFNNLDVDHFVVTVQNPTGLNFTITTINLTVEGGSPLNITDYVVPSLPRMLTPDTNLTFMCEWNWAGDQGKNVTITIVTLEGYTTSYTRKIPSA